MNVQSIESGLVNRLKIAFRTDASNQIGIGHVMRCLTLADALRVRGADSSFVCRPHSGHLIELIRQRGYTVYTLPPPDANAINSAIHEPNALAHAAWLGDSWSKDCDQSVVYLAKLKPDVVVVDHYAIDARWETQILPFCTSLMVIDDLADRPHGCDLLLDQNWFGSDCDDRYAALLPEACAQLLGPGYALLKPEYAVLRGLLPNRDGVIRRILVFLGGSDPTNETGKVLSALVREEFSDIALDVILGPNHPDPDGIRRMAAARSGVTVYQALPSLAGLMMRADLMISGGGATSWERMCLGLPAIAISIADNQTSMNLAMAKVGYVEFAGVKHEVDAMRIAGMVRSLQLHTEVLCAMSEKSLALVSGSGADLVCDALLDSVRLASHVSSSIAVLPKDGIPSGAPNRGEDKNSDKPLYIVASSKAWHRTAFEHISLEDADCRWRWISTPEELLSVGADEAQPRYIFFIHWNWRVPEEIWSTIECVCFHMTDVPYGRGGSPLQNLIVAGHRRTKLSALRMVAEMDAGPVYTKRDMHLDGRAEDIYRHAGLLSFEIIRWIIRANPQAMPQEGEALVFKRRRPEQSELPHDGNLCQLYDHIRMLDAPTYPLAFIDHGEFRCEFRDARLEGDELFATTRIHLRMDD